MSLNNQISESRNNKKKMRKINKLYIAFLISSIMIMMFGVASLASAVTLDLGTNLSINGAEVYVDTIALRVDQAIVNDTGCEDTICLYNASWQNGNLIVNHTGLINWTSGAIKTSEFTRLTTDTAESKVFAQSNPIFTTQVTISVDNCNSIGNINHKGSDGTAKTSFQQGDYTCSNNQAILNLNNVANGDTIAIFYGCDSNTRMSFGLIMLFFALSIVSIVIYIGYQGIYGDGITLNQVLIGAIVVIVGVIFWQTSGQNLGTYCPIG